jgi:hypothetical protein
MCGRCGVYVGGQMEEAGRYHAIANLRMPRGHHFARPILAWASALAERSSFGPTRQC